MKFKVGQTAIIVNTVDVSSGRMDMFLKKGTSVTVISYMCNSLVNVKVDGLDEEIVVYETDLEDAK